MPCTSTSVGASGSSVERPCAGYSRTCARHARTHQIIAVIYLVPAGPTRLGHGQAEMRRVTRAACPRRALRRNQRPEKEARGLGPTLPRCAVARRVVTAFGLRLRGGRRRARARSRRDSAGTSAVAPRPARAAPPGPPPQPHAPRACPASAAAAWLAASEGLGRARLHLGRSPAPSTAAALQVVHHCRCHWCQHCQLQPAIAKTGSR